MQIIKPQQLILLNGRYQIGRQSHLGISMVAGFYLSQPRHFACEADIWHGWQQAPMSHQVLDLAEPKPFAEYLLAGHAGIGEPIKALDVAVKVGGLQRQWRVEGAATQAALQVQPFLQMPLDHRQSYGGENSAANPLGRGHKDGLAPMLMPLMNGIPQGGAPLAAPGPIPPGFQVRKAWLDKVTSEMSGKSYLVNVFPGYPASLDRQFFQLAAPAQRYSEAEWPDDICYELEGFRPGGEILRGVFPRVQARAFYSDKERPEQLRSLRMERKTLWLLPDCDLGLMIFTGHLPLAYLLEEPLASVMIALDSLEAPRSDRHYQQVFSRRRAKQGGELESLYDPDLMPAGMGMNVINAMEHNPQSLAYLPGPRHEYLAYYQLLRQKIDQQQDGGEKTVPPLEKIKWETFPQANAKTLFQLAQHSVPAAENEIFTCQSLEQRSLQKAIFRQCHFADCNFTQVELEDCLFEYCCFENCSFASVNFNRCNLHKNRFSDCAFEQTMVSGCQLEQVTFDRVKAIDFRSQQSDWQGCRWDKSHWESTCFSGGALDNATFSACLFGKLELRGIELNSAIFKQCNLSKSRWQQVELRKGSLFECNCQAMVWRHCQIESATLTADCILRQIDIEQSTLQQVGMRGVDLSSATFSGCVISEANFEAADLSYSRVTRCEIAGGGFKDADMQHSLWQRSSLQQAMLYHADLRSARFDHCNLVAANMAQVRRDRDNVFNHCLMDEVMWYPFHQEDVADGGE
ncbi:pentapeptide repeat-containing protein [Enterobacter asburiae]|uniref:DUF2169 family type VI secretion system accessory protein n=1 Tax=Scandinavium sp. UTDF21-P1B TaxID=3446379 RepID=UPI0034803174